MASEKFHNLFCKAGLGIYKKSMTKPLRKFHSDIAGFLFLTFRLYVDLLNFYRQFQFNSGFKLPTARKNKSAKNH